MALPIGAAAVSGGLGLLSTLGTLLGQSSANSQNIAMQRETNALNYQMFQESQAFARDQQKLAMEYNDPAAQAQRLRAAGINPAGVFGNGSVSEVSQAASPSSPNMVAPQVQPLDYSGFGAAAQFATQAYFENQLKESQVSKTENESLIASVNAQFELMAFENKLAKVANDKSLSDFERETAKMRLSILRETQGALVRQEGLRADVLDKQVEDLQVRIDGQKIANNIADIDLDWHNKEKSQNFQLFSAKIAEAYAAARSGDAAAAASLASAALSDAQKDGVKVDNDTKRKVQSYVVQSAKDQTVLNDKTIHKTYWEGEKAKREAREGYITSKFLPYSAGEHISHFGE